MVTSSDELEDAAEAGSAGGAASPLRFLLLALAILNEKF